MLVVVTYDVSNDKRLRKVHKLMKNYSIPVQYSVFECDLDTARIEDMITEVLNIIETEEDALLIYPVCLECRNKVMISGQGEIWADQSWWVV